MVDLGVIEVRKKASLYRVGRKVRELALELGLGEVESSRLAAGAVGAMRLFLEHNQALIVSVSLEGRPRAALVLRFKAARGVDEESLALLSRFSDEVTAVPGEDEKAVEVRKRLPGLRIEVTEEFVTRTKERLERPTEEELMELLVSQMNFTETALNSLKDIFLALDMEGRLVKWNRSLELVSGRGKEELQNLHFSELLGSASASLVIDADLLRRQVEDGPYTFEAKLKTRHRGDISCEVTLSALPDAGGGRAGFCGIVRDITERERLEKELIEALLEAEAAKERAQSADRLKSAFLATMSHELRTPLNSIIGFTGILLQGLAGPLNEEQSKQLGMVRHSASHLLDLINDILDLSKIEAGQLEIFPVSFDLGELLESVRNTIEPAAEGKGLYFKMEYSPVAEAVRADRRRLEQVLLNLLSNAVKFTEEGGVTLRCGVEGGRLFCSVEDTGIGIKAEDMDKLFQPFRQLDMTTTRTKQGTGLGLSICKRLLELMGGAIEVESEYGKGSVFRFTLPV